MMEIKLTAVLNMLDDFRSIRRTIYALSQQTIREQMEVIIVAPRSAAGNVDRAALEGFGAYQVVEVDEMQTGAAGWAAGIRVAQAPLVVMCEDHSFPPPNWAAALIHAHGEGDYFAVSPAVRNGNPDTRTSWANFLLSFLEWYDPEAPKLIDVTAGHNTCYRKDMLLADYGNGLEKWLNPERVMHVDAFTRGRKLLLDSRTYVRHVNISQTSSYMGMSYAGGRVFGAARSLNWGMARRVFYAVLFPVVPVIRLKRLMAALNTSDKRRNARFFPTLPLIVPGLFCHALGEAVGYVFGEGGIAPKYGMYELRRKDYVTAREREWMLSTDGEQG